MNDEESTLDKAVRLQNGLIARATGGGDFDGAAYKALRSYFMSRVETKGLVPDFVRRCSDTAQFWGLIKYEYASYQERREFIWDRFRPLIEQLERTSVRPVLYLSLMRSPHSILTMCNSHGRRRSTAD
jgi:hypothetical protein